ncbi:MAG: hypothetical protein ACPGVG_08710 [Mycobacterium sp.]
MKSNTAANGADYGSMTTEILPGDVVTFQGRRKPYLVIGIFRSGGQARVDLTALSGGFGASSADSVLTDRLTKVDQPIEFSGAKATDRSRDAFRRALNRVSAEDVRYLAENGGVNLDNMLTLIRAYAMANAV